MDEEIKIPHGTLSDEDLDVLSGMMVVFMHAAEKCLSKMETHYELEYMAGKEYQYYCKIYGKDKTDAIVHNQVRKVIRGDERNQLGKIIKAAKDFHKAQEKLFETAIKSHTKETTDVQSLDGLMHDVNFLCYVYALMCNCNGSDDEIKLLSTVKVMAKGDRVCDNLLEKLKIQ